MRPTPRMKHKQSPKAAKQAMPANAVASTPVGQPPLPHPNPLAHAGEEARPTGCAASPPEGRGAGTTRNAVAGLSPARGVVPLEGEGAAGDSGGVPLQPSPPKTAHPRTVSGQAQKARTRAAIIQVAIPIFARHGPDIPVIDDFVKAAGVSRGTFYNYFQTTRDLLEASMACISDELIEAIIPAVGDEPNPVIRFATAARLFYRRARLDPVFRAFLGSVSSVGNLAAQRARGDLEEAIETGLVKVKDIELAEAIAFGVMVFALRTSKVETGGQERAREVVRAILNALGVEPDLIDRAMRVALPPPPPVPPGNP